MPGGDDQELKTNIADYYCCENGGLGREENKILLVYPKVGSEAQKVSLYPPLSLLYLASYLKDFSVAIFDQRVDRIEDFKALLEQKPVCVGFSVMTGPQIQFSLELAELARKMKIPTVFGGVHPSILPAQTKMDERVDYVVVGEGELAFRHLIERLVDKDEIDNPIIASEPIDLNKDLRLPYELVDVEKYIYSSAIEGRALPVLFSRGCPFACTFCCNPVITKRKWRSMDIELLLKQIDELVERYRLDSIIFWDENLTVHPKLVNGLAKRINGKFKWYSQSRINVLLKYDLAFLERMGLWRLSCGIESGSPRILELIKKEETVEEYIEFNRRLAKTNISAWFNYIIGFPDENIEDLKLTVKLAMQILDENQNANNSTFFMLVPYPGTEIGDRLISSNIFPDTFEGWADFGRYNFNAPWYDPEMLKLYKRICFSSKFVGRKILRLFPTDRALKEMVMVMSEKWRNFDFYRDEEWEKLENSGWEILNRLFGENAY